LVNTAVVQASVSQPLGRDPREGARKVFWESCDVFTFARKIRKCNICKLIYFNDYHDKNRRTINTTYIKGQDCFLHNNGILSKKDDIAESLSNIIVLGVIKLIIKTYVINKLFKTVFHLKGFQCVVL
jgi:hypothetical protein